MTTQNGGELIRETSIRIMMRGAVIACERPLSFGEPLAIAACLELTFGWQV